MHLASVLALLVLLVIAAGVTWLRARRYQGRHTARGSRKAAKAAARSAVILAEYGGQAAAA